MIKETFTQPSESPEALKDRLGSVRNQIAEALQGKLIGMREQLLQELDGAAVTYQNLLKGISETDQERALEEIAAVTVYLENVPRILTAVQEGRPLDAMHDVRTPLLPHKVPDVEQLNHLQAMIGRVILLRMAEISEKTGAEIPELRFDKDNAATEYDILPQMAAVVEAARKQLEEIGCSQTELDDALRILGNPIIWSGTTLEDNRTAFKLDSMERLGFTPYATVTACVPLWLRTKFETLNKHLDSQASDTKN